MKVNRIDFDDDGTPIEVTLSATIDEICLISRVLGSLSPMAMKAIAPDYAGEQRAILSELDAMVYNRYWTEGLDGAMGGTQSIPLNEIVLTYLRNKTEGGEV